MAKLNSDSYINRELSWLEFNNRVLNQAMSDDNPLFERINFLSIVCSNLDEFYMIRVGSLVTDVKNKSRQTDAAGMDAREQLTQIAHRVAIMMDTVYVVYASLMSKLNDEGIELVKYDDLTPDEKSFCDDYFRTQLYPLITPTLITRGRAFPLVANGGLNIAALFKKSDGGERLANVTVPTGLGRFVRLPGTKIRFILVEEIVRNHISAFFGSLELTENRVYRVMRNGDLPLLEDEFIDLLSAVKSSLTKRRHGSVVRLEIEAGVSGSLKSRLTNVLGVSKKHVFELGGPVNLTFLPKLTGSLEGFASLKYPPFKPYTPAGLEAGTDIFEAIKKRDWLLYHPFDSFDPVVRFVTQAASDNDVLAIKITLYRVSKSSPIVAALKQAARNGKDVTVLFEARARFDEENNIGFGSELSLAGASVIYGLPHVKTHSKITLVVRREHGRNVNYVHLGTGNYNDVTARLYTDYSLLTADRQLGADATDFFHSLSGGMLRPEPVLIVPAPYEMRARFESELKREREKAKQGQEACVFAKMNSLTDERMIKQLYKTSQAGVKIRLLVRGICCLRPGIPGLSENIEVRSVVGRFLEHSRIYCFGSGSDRRLYLSSADWMTRNLDRRVELLFPLLTESVRKKVADDFELYWSDNIKARVMNSDGRYFPVENGEEPLNAQEALIEKRKTEKR